MIDVGSVNYMAGFYARNHILGFSPLIYLGFTVGHKVVSDIYLLNPRAEFCSLQGTCVSLGILSSSVDLGELSGCKMDCLAFLPALLAPSLQLLTGVTAHLLSLNACVASAVTKGLITS